MKEENAYSFLWKRSYLSLFVNQNMNYELHLRIIFMVFWYLNKSILLLSSNLQAACVLDVFE